MKSLLSYTTKHFDPNRGVIYGHSVGREAKIWYDVLSEFGEVDHIDNTNTSVAGKEYDVLVSLPRNFEFLTRNNKFGKTIVSLNLPEPGYLHRVMSQNAAKIGCKLSDCFQPRGFRHADKFVLLGGNFNWQLYKEAGYDMEKFVAIKYGFDDFEFKPREKNKRPIFLHVATTLGLRKGFWHVVNDFKKADIDAELWCVGAIQRENFWIDFAKQAQTDPRIKVLGWIDCFDPKYKELMYASDFVVFPSWGEGQPGTVMEAMATGCLPFISLESGTPFHAWHEYVRGNTKKWQDLANLPNDEFMEAQLWIQDYLKNEGYSYKTYEEIVRSTIKSL